MTDEWIIFTGHGPPQIIVRFFLTRGRLVFGCIGTKFGMQSHNIVRILLTSQRTVMKIPTFATTVFVGMIRCFQVGTGRGTAFGKIPPPLRGLILRVTHESHRKEFALHRIAGVSPNGGLFVQECVGGKSSNGNAGKTLGFESLENVFPSTEHVPVLVENIQHGAAAETGYEFLYHDG